MIQPSPSREEAQITEPDHQEIESHTQQATQQDAVLDVSENRSENPYADPNAWGILYFADKKLEMIGAVTIGRKPDCTIPLKDNVKISGVHCKLLPPKDENSSPVIIDLRYVFSCVLVFAPFLSLFQL